MKNFLILSTLITAMGATPLVLTPQQEADWNIETQEPKSSKVLSIGKCMAEVVTPPQLLQTISLPFEAQVKKLFVANYENIKKGQLLAEVTGKDWIELQQKFIADAIELKQNSRIATRKNRLCQEQIIPQKECTAANSEYKANKIKVSASKALLRSYGADNRLINDLFEHLKIAPTMTIHANGAGRIIQLNAQTGKSISPSEALFVIQKEGALWLEANMLAYKSTHLDDKAQVHINFNHETFESKLLLHAPTINPNDQTQKVRFSLPNSSKFLTGMRGTVKISIDKPTLKVAKKSVISYNDEEVVFVKDAKGYTPVAITILGEDEHFYYLEDTPALHAPIATSSIAILKSLMEGQDE
jgi:cobalt-zinc-cadmium efflux system membrane fusion protein